MRQAEILNPVLYASPYMVVTPSGYTKHYFVGNERFASRIGDGKITSISSHAVATSLLASKQTTVNRAAPDSIVANKFLFLRTLSANWSAHHTTYWLHPDHLGSTNWVTDTAGHRYQHMLYKPWGEVFVSQPTTTPANATRYKFSGKEQDPETGFCYFGARLHNPALSLWLSVDPLSDKYPGVSPYVYCADNPVKYFDPDGEDYEVVVDDKKRTITIKANYVVYDVDDNVSRAQAAVDAWNSVSGKYEFKNRKNGTFTINYELTVTSISDVDEFENYSPQSTSDNKLDFVGSLPNTTDGRTVYGLTTYSNEELQTKSFNNISIGTGRHKTIMHEIGHTLGLGHGSGVMEQGTDNTEIHAGHIQATLTRAGISTFSWKNNSCLPNQVKVTFTKEKITFKMGLIKKKSE